MQKASLINFLVNKEIVTRIENLQPTSQAKWGKMNVAQMLAHCQEPIKIGLGITHAKRGLLGILFGQMFKKKFLKQGFTNNLPTSPEFVIVSDKSFTTEKQQLITLVKKLAEPNAITCKKHPFFGKITEAEWGEISYLHLHHHLKQFGA